MDWLSVVKAVAPWIGTAIGGPLGGLAVDAAASAVGLSDRTADAVKQAITSATPEQLLAVKQADQAFALQIQALGFKQLTDLEGLAAGDRKDARAMQIAQRFVGSCGVVDHRDFRLFRHLGRHDAERPARRGLAGAAVDARQPIHCVGGHGLLVRGDLGQCSKDRAFGKLVAGEIKGRRAASYCVFA